MGRRPPRSGRRSWTDSSGRSKESFLLGITVTRNEFLGAGFEETEDHPTTHKGLDHQGGEGEDAVESRLIIQRAEDRVGNVRYEYDAEVEGTVSNQSLHYG